MGGGRLKHCGHTVLAHDLLRTFHTVLAHALGVNSLLPIGDLSPERHLGSKLNHVSLLFYPPSQKATGVNPWMNARWVPSVALAKEGTLRRVPPDEACGEVPRP